MKSHEILKEQELRNWLKNKALDNSFFVRLSLWMRDQYGIGITEATQAIIAVLANLPELAYRFYQERNQAVIKSRRCKVCKEIFKYKTFLDRHCKNDY